MKQLLKIVTFILLITAMNTAQVALAKTDKNAVIKLPPVKITSNLSLNQAIQKRRSVRDFTAKPLSIDQITQLLWAAQGVTDETKGFRSTPSAGALYPLDIYLVKADGVWLYHPKSHSLEKIIQEDLRTELSQIAYNQTFVEQAPVNFVIVGTFNRATEKYGESAIQFTYVEAGHASQNILLEVQELGLAAVSVGGFNEQSLRNLFKFSLEKAPIYIISVGNPK